MCDSASSSELDSITTVIHPLGSDKGDELETAEEAGISDSDDYLSESLRYRRFQYSESSDSNVALQAQNMTISERADNFYSLNGDINANGIEIPIVGYEILEERARFTVYKLKVENKSTGNFWYVFRRYTDFVRLCNRLRASHPDIVQHLPRKRWLKNNFDPIFLEERVNSLQTLVNAILNVPDLITSKEVQDFFCLNEPPIYSETNEESKAIFEAFEETINDLKQHIREKDLTLKSIQSKFHSLSVENENLKQIIRNKILNCQKCQTECKNFTKLFK